MPNAGTRLVIDVMNEIKREFPFVDLLKPETDAVIPTLLALRPRLAAKLAGALPAAGRLAWDAVRRATGFLSAEDEDDTGDAAAAAGCVGPGVPGRTSSSVPRATADGRAAIEAAAARSPARFLGEVMQETFASKPGSAPLRFENVDDLLEATQERLEQGVSPYDLLEVSSDYQMLGIMGAIRNLIARKGAAEVLREALERVQKDRSFDLKQADDTYSALLRYVGPDVQFLVTGHTHLERALPLGRNGGAYFNSGTWVRLIRFSPEMLRDSKRFGNIFGVLKSGRMASLDAAENGALVQLRPAVVFIRAGTDEGGSVIGDLQRVSAADGATALTEVPRSRFLLNPLTQPKGA